MTKESTKMKNMVKELPLKGGKERNGQGMREEESK